MRPQKHVSRAPPRRRNMSARALCITIPDDRGDESFADDLNMGRGIVSGRVALLLRSTEIRPHRPKDLLPPSRSPNPGSPPPSAFLNTWPKHKLPPGLHSRVPPSSSHRDKNRPSPRTGLSGLPHNQSGQKKVAKKFTKSPNGTIGTPCTAPGTPPQPVGTPELIGTK